MRRLLAVAVIGLLFAGLARGGLTVTFASGSASNTVALVEVPFTPLAAGSSGGLNGTQGTASVASALLTTTTDLLYLNNTNVTGAWYAKLVLISSTGVAGMDALTVGIDNGTQHAQVTGALGLITAESGAYVKLEPGSTNKLYLTQLASVLQTTTALGLDVYVADDAAESAFVVTVANITIT